MNPDEVSGESNPTPDVSETERQTIGPADELQRPAPEGWHQTHGEQPMIDLPLCEPLRPLR